MRNVLHHPSISLIDLAAVAALLLVWASALTAHGSDEATYRNSVTYAVAATGCPAEARTHPARATAVAPASPQAGFWAGRPEGAAPGCE